jgi:hypothetical protein
MNDERVAGPLFAAIRTMARRDFFVMAGLVPAIHDFLQSAIAGETWMPGTRPGMTEKSKENWVPDQRRTAKSSMRRLRTCIGALRRIRDTRKM